LLLVPLVLLSACGGEGSAPDHARGETAREARPQSPAVDAGGIRALQQRALSDSTALELIESLTTEVGARLAGTEGDFRAVAWAERRMKALGFDRVWKQPVEFPVWRRRAESAALVAPRRQPLAATALGGSPPTDGRLLAEVVAFPDLESLQAADPLAVRGKIAFINKRMERSSTGAGYSAAVSGRSRGPMAAAEKGAVALVIRSVGTSNDRFAHTGNISSTAPGERVPSAAISNPDADLLERMLAAGEAVRMELELDVGYEGRAVSHNVIGEFDGNGESDEFVIVGGHLDSWDLGAGAHDNAAGVATTMAAAALAAGFSERPRRGIRVVLFANEEQGIYGGREYARLAEAELGRHAVGAESDLGAGAVRFFRARVLPEAEPAVAELAAWLEPLDIPLRNDRPATGGADLGNLRRLGMPVIDLSHDASLYFDVHHTANDTLDKIIPGELAHNVAAFATFIWWAANADVQFGPVPPSE
jgi:Zn-dependent M28 family amino/carboxypeptidase